MIQLVTLVLVELSLPLLDLSAIAKLIENPGVSKEMTAIRNLKNHPRQMTC
jgi:hypothetical protein